MLVYWALLNGADLRAHELGTFDRMRKMKMPDGPIRNKMKMDGVGAKVVATYFGEALPETEAAKVMQTPSSTPDLAKCAKIKEMRMPGAVRNKMKTVMGKTLRFVFLAHAKPSAS